MNSSVFKLYIKGITQYVHFCVVFYSMTTTQLVYSSVNRHLDCFGSGAITMNKASMNIPVRISSGGICTHFCWVYAPKLYLSTHC